MIKIKEYGVYDLKEDEQCIYIGTMSEVSKFLNYNKDTLWSYLSRKKHDRSLLISHRYEIVEVIEENKEIEELNDNDIYDYNHLQLKINELVRAVNKLNKERERE